MLLNKFKLKNWARLTPAKRQDVLQKLENKMAKRAGRPAMPISAVVHDEWSNFGMFEFASGKAVLHLNVMLLSSDKLRFQALATVLHEGRHCMQHYAAHGDLSFFEFRAKRWRKNMENYVASGEDAELYRMQEVERDAQKFAIKKLEKWSYKFRNEDDFWLVLNNLKRRFEETEMQAKEKYGKFYRHKIRRKINKRF